MKKFYIVSVKDELTGAFLQPTFGETLEELKRLFAYQVNKIDLWRYNSSDYTLYCLGTFDQETGEIMPHIERLVNGRAVVKQEEKE